MKKAVYSLCLVFLLLACTTVLETPILPEEPSTPAPPQFAVLRLENPYSGSCTFTYVIALDGLYVCRLTNGQFKEVTVLVDWHIITGSVRKYCPGAEVEPSRSINDNVYVGESGLVWRWYY